MFVERMYDGRCCPELVKQPKLGFISGSTAQLKVEASRWTGHLSGSGITSGATGASASQFVCVSSELFLV